MDRADLPEEFLARLGRLLGPDVEAFLTAFAAPADGLRVNTLRLSPEEFERISPFPLRRLGYPDDLYVLLGGDRPGRHPFHAGGLYYLQDPSAAIVGALVDSQPGERVLDLAAAPGGKTTQLAAGMRNTGFLVANDVVRARAGELVGNLERCGVRNALVTSESADRLGRHFGGFFDRVLVDAPCSGESMFPKSTAALADWSPNAVLGCARRQGELLRDAAGLVRPGGLMVYSTCTFSDEENEDVMAAFLDEHPDFDPAALPLVDGAETVWVGRTDRSSDRISANLAGQAAGYRLWPHRVPGAGHFVFAVRRRLDGRGTGVRQAQPRDSRRAARRESRALLEDFLTEVYSGLGMEDGALLEAGEELFALPGEAPELGGLRLVRTGLWLGTARRGRFEPAHALAMALPPSLAPHRLDLAIDDPRVELYLKGHPLDAPGEPGWVPVCVEGFALGWGKRVGRTVKNHYPKGLRWR